jgi:hypothetical protein
MDGAVTRLGRRMPGLLALGGTLWACGSVRPLDPATHIDRRPAAELVLRLDEPCTTLPGGTPMGRPDGVRSNHLLPAGRYRPLLEDDRGVYFASPSGITVTEPAPRGTRSRPGGVYVPHDSATREPAVEGRGAAWEYLGDTDGISSRQLLPQHCRFELVGAEPEKKD